MRGNFDYSCFTPGMTDQGCKSELSVYSFTRLFVTAKVQVSIFECGEKDGISWVLKIRLLNEKLEKIF